MRPRAMAHWPVRDRGGWAAAGSTRPSSSVAGGASGAIGASARASRASVRVAVVVGSSRPRSSPQPSKSSCRPSRCARSWASSSRACPSASSRATMSPAISTTLSGSPRSRPWAMVPASAWSRTPRWAMDSRRASVTMPRIWDQDSSPWSKAAWVAGIARRTSIARSRKPMSDPVAPVSRATCRRTDRPSRGLASATARSTLAMAMSTVRSWATARSIGSTAPSAVSSSSQSGLVIGSTQPSSHHTGGGASNSP